MKLLGGILAATSVLGVMLVLAAKRRSLSLPRGLVFADNSCHMDSLLFAIFAFPENPLADLIFDESDDVDEPMNPCSIEQRIQIRAELKRITDAMHGRSGTTPTNYTCTNLRLLIGQCRNLLASDININLPKVLQDPRDTLMLLLKVFPLQRTSTMIRTTERFLVENNLPNPRFPATSEINFGTVFTVDLTSFTGHQLSDSLLSKPYPLDDGKTEYAVTKYTFQVPYFVFDVQRLTRTNKILKNRIIPDHELNPQQVQSVAAPAHPNPLQLQSIVSYVGWPHYVAFARDPATDIWFYYNDVKNPPVVRVGSYAALLKFQNQLVQKFGVLFFYW